MEHIVQFAIGIDDEAIKKRVVEAGYTDIIKQLKYDCTSAIGSSGYWKNWSRDTLDWGKFAEDCMNAWMDEHRDEIIEAAAAKLANSYKRTKAFKDRVKEKLDEVDG